jgi:hypothetical protein
MDAGTLIAAALGPLLATVAVLYAQRRRGQLPKQSRRARTASVIAACLLILIAFIALMLGSVFVSAIALMLAAAVSAVIIFTAVAGD